MRDQTKINLETIKKTFKETYEKFKECINKKSLKLEKKEIARNILCNWMDKIIDDTWIMNLSERIINFQSLIGFKKEINCKLSFSKLQDVLTQKFAEIDCAIYLTKEFCLEKSEIKKLLKETNTSTCDFLVKDFYYNKLLVEVKTIQKIEDKHGLREKKIIEVIQKALKQIESFAKRERIKKFRGAVWIFTYNFPIRFNELQDLINKIKNSEKRNFNYSLTLQVYEVGLFGDSSFL